MIERTLKNTKKRAKPGFLSDILINYAIEGAKKDEKEIESTKKFSEKIFLPEDEDTNYKILKECKEKNVGGYGAVSNIYGIVPNIPYINYGKIFSYLGKFKSQSAYEYLDDSSEKFGKSMGENNSFSLIDLETSEKGARYVKYFMSNSSGIDPISMMPIAGMNSAEWEQFKLWMKLDPVMYRLKTSTS